MIIRNFNDFNLINESFNSPKLKSIVMQNGLPKNKLDRSILHDTTDEDIVDVLDTKEEFQDIYNKDHKYDGSSWDARWNKVKYFYVELENGKILVLKNIDTFKNNIESEYGENIETLFTKIQKKYNDRHIGKQPNTGDTIERKHEKNVNTLKGKQLKARIASDDETVMYIADIVNDYLQDYLDNNLDVLDLDRYNGTFENDDPIYIDIFGEKYLMWIKASYSLSDEKNSISIEADEIYICNDDGDIGTDVYDLYKKYSKEFYKEFDTSDPYDVDTIYRVGY